MLKINRSKTRTKQEWVELFSKARDGHIIWDGWAPDPYNPEHAYKSARQFVKQAVSYGFFTGKSKILDIGCGNGRLGIALSELPVYYSGLDPMIKCIEFCKEVYAPYPQFEFRHLDVYNECSNPEGKIDPAQLTLPYPDGYFDNVVAYSVFTHLQNIETATRYMDEIRRVLKPRGKFFSSWYRSPPNEVDTFVGRTTYLESDIMTILHGFRFLHTYGGHSPQYYDQWGLFAEKF